MVVFTQTRLASTAKAQYHPTDEEAVRIIAQMVKVDPGSYILDPSCGEGIALNILGRAWKAETWGNEIEKERFEKAGQILDHVVLGPMESLRVEGLFDVVFINPPYDMGSVRRYEHEHVELALPWLGQNGLIIAVLPWSILETKGFWSMWLGHVSNSSTYVYRIPEPEFSKWKQFVVFGRAGRYSTYDGWRQSETWARKFSDEGALFPTLSVTPEPFHVRCDRWSRGDPPKVSNNLPAAADLMADAELMPPIWDLPEYKALTTLPTSMERGRPAMPCRACHVVQLGAAGMFNGQQMTVNGESYLVSGSSYKYKETFTQVTDQGKEETVEAERMAYQIFGFGTKDGHFLQLDSHRDQKSYRHFLKEGTESLIDAVNRARPPAYDWDYQPWISAFDKLHAPRVLPGHEGNGLLNAQKHVVAAILEVIKRQKTYQNMLLVGEMGVGKTFVALAAMAILSGILEGNQKARIVVLSPAVVAPKWQEEATAILKGVPGFKAFLIGQKRKQVHQTLDSVNGLAMIDYQYLAAKLAGKYPARGTKLTTIEAYRWQRFQDSPTLDWDAYNSAAHSSRSSIRKPILDTINAWNHPGPAMLIIPYEVAKNGAPWEHVTIGREEEVSYEVEEDLFDRWGSKTGTRSVSVTETVPVYHCPQCHHRLVDEEGRPWQRSEFGKFSTNTQRMVKQFCPMCGGALWQCKPFAYGGRWPVCAFINKHYPNQYYLIVDEAHNTKGGDTNIGAASQDLITSAKNTIAMTGTIFNGMARSLFYLLYRLNPEFRQLYEHDDASKFVQHHGFMDIVTRTSETRSTSRYGYSSTRENTFTREAPGASPAMVAMLMPQTVFLKLNDIGIELPPKDEVAVPVPMSDELQAGFGQLQAGYKNAAAAFVKGERGPMSRWHQAALGWFDAPQQSEKEFKVQPVAMPPKGYPKDQILANLVIENLNENRGVAIYFEQVHARDARTRVRNLLAEQGITAEILEEKVAADERMPWINNLTKTCRRKGQEPVLLCNGNLIKEGIDLLDYPTMVEVGQHYNIVNLRQRLARSHRLGQVHDVRLYFLYYEGTRQEDALERIATKMRAASQVDGDIPAGIEEFNMDEDDFVLELMRSADELHHGEIAGLMQTKRFDSPVKFAPKVARKESARTPAKLVPIHTIKIAVRNKTGDEIGAQLGFAL